MTSVSDLPAAHDAFSHSLICSTLMTGIDMGKHYVICREKENSGDSSRGSMFDVRCSVWDVRCSVWDVRFLPGKKRIGLRLGARRPVCKNWPCGRWVKKLQLSGRRS